MKNVIVTGGSRGLGLAIVERLMRTGYDVSAIARSKNADLRALMDAPRRDGEGRIVFFAHDLADLAGARDLVRRIATENGALWGLVNNAGLGSSGVLANMRDDKIEALVRLNTVAPIVLTKYVLRALMTTGTGGRIVNMASVVASTGFSGLAAYAATKASMIGFTRSMAREVGPLGITVNAIAPGFIDTEMTDGLDAAQRAQIARRSALGRLAEAGDVASAVAYLMSADAKNITGTVLTVDAGGTA
jgi:3-oxoacyl-[acyl-carrier protein] reductase